MKKFLAILATVLVLTSTFAFMIIPASAVGYDSYNGYWIFNETLSFPASTTETVLSGFQFVNKLDGSREVIVSAITISAGDGNRSMTFTYGTAGNSYMAYGELRDNWTTGRVINVIECNDSLASFLDQHATRYDNSTSDDYNKGFDAGYNAGYVQGKSDGYNQGFSAGSSEGYDLGYDAGYDDGFLASGSANFGKNLLGDTLNVPINALNGFVLFKAPNGIDVTLGGVVGAVIGLSLFVMFLKIFAGG